MAPRKTDAVGGVHLKGLWAASQHKAEGGFGNFVVGNFWVREVVTLHVLFDQGPGPVPSIKVQEE